MVKGFFITAILVALSFGQALAGEPRESAPELAVGPQFLDLSRYGNGQDDGQPLFDLNMGRETLWLDFEQAPFDQRRDAPLTPPDAIVDVYPFDGNLRFTGGMIYDNSAFGSDTRGEALGGLPFTPSTGLSPGTIDWNQYTPYAGVGLQSSFLKGRLEFAIDLGLSYEGAAEVDPTGPAEPGAEAAALGDSRQDGTESLNVLGFSPRAGLSLRFRF